MLSFHKRSSNQYARPLLFATKAPPTKSLPSAHWWKPDNGMGGIEAFRMK